MTPLLTPSHDLSDLIHGQPHPDRLYRQVQNLPRRTRQVLLYSRLDELPYLAIAQRLHTTVADVEARMQDALRACCKPALTGQSMAIHWYVKLQSPLTTASERIDFRRWLDSDSAHLAAFHATELHWRQLLAPATLLGHDRWHHKARQGLGLRGWVTAGLAMALAMELISQSL
jgi:hypothetical protein